MNHEKGKHLRSTIMFSIVGGAVIMNPAFAQNTQSDNQSAAPAEQVSQQSSDNDQQAAVQLGVVNVTGVRNALEQSMNLKRYSVGVVDAISAEDIGKFPDTNLAASLQRITGVSISRRNGAGALVTVRGFGPQFNIVTLNGRHIPGAEAFGAAGQVPLGNVNGGSRSFNFAQLSPNAVRALEVHKTGRANKPSGGIGATINVVTAKPFDYQGGDIIGSVKAKAIYDTSSPFDDSTTPAFSGTFSYANPDKTWGITLTANVQKREGGDVEVTENAWNVQKWNGGVYLRNNATVNNAPAMGQLYGIPNDIRYAFKDFEAERQNGHATFQVRPADSLTLTLDYLYSKYRIKADRGEQSMWLQKSFTDITFDTDQPVATPVYLRDITPPGHKDFGMEQQHYDQVYRLNDVGFNAAWDVTSDLRLTFDAHDSTAKSLPNDAATNGGGATFISIAGTNNCTDGPQCGGEYVQEFRFNGNFPTATRTWYPSLTEALNKNGGVVNKPFTPGEIGTQPLRVNAQAQVTEVQEAKIGGDLDFDSGRFQFGASYQKSELHRTQAKAVNGVNNPPNLLGNWAVTDAGAPGLIDHLYPVSTVGEFDGYDTGGIAKSTWRGNANALAQWGKKHYPGAITTVSQELSANQRVEEKTKALYAQVTLFGDIGGMPTTTRFGLRYQKTDVTSTSQIAIPSDIVWQSNNDFGVLTSSDRKPFSVDASYDNLLPNVDFNIEFTNELKGRASYSKTIARAPYGNLYAGPGAGAPNGSILVNTANRAGGNRNNPGLKPLVSDNVDLGLGWYFAPSSYVSVTYWTKRVANFIGTGTTRETLFGLTDPTSGPRAQEALDFLNSNACDTAVTSNGGDPTGLCTVSNTNLFSTVALLSNKGETGGLAAYGKPGQVTDLEVAYDITGNNNDPLYQFDVSHPINQHTSNLHGWEIGGQYFFGQSGFGIMANYTIVNGDVHFDDTGDPGVDQFALTGLSDSGNAVLIFEKYGFSARLAYNWRGEYLYLTNQGNSANPYYVDPHQQYDLSVSYAVTDHLAVFAQGVNLTGEDIRWHGRSEKQFVRIADLKPRYAVGVRYEF